MQSLFQFAQEDRPKKETPARPRPFATEVTSGTAARVMKVSRGTVENLCEEGKLRAWRLRDNGWWRIDYSSVLEFLAERRDGTLFPEK